MKVNHDKLIISTIYSKLRPNSKYISHIDKYPNITAYLKNRYEDGYDTIREILDRIKFHIESRPICKVCGNHVKYVFLIHGTPTWKEHCSSKCSRISASQSTKKTCLEKYGVDNAAKLEATKQRYKETCLEKYGVDNVFKSNKIKEKIKQTCIKKYGVNNPFKCKEIKFKAVKTSIKKYGKLNFNNKEKAKTTNIVKYGYETPLLNKTIQNKIKETCIKKYGSANPLASEFIRQKIKKTCIKKYGVDHPMKNNIISSKVKQKLNTEKVKDKAINSKRKNHTFNTSKPEELLYKNLVNKYGKDDIIRQYRSDVYPFACDFYIKSQDLYIEFQGMWTHGKHAFNPESEEDNLVLEQWKEKAKTSRFYNNAIETWTVRDVNKREIAKRNNLNYIEIWDKIKAPGDFKFLI